MTNLVAIDVALSQQFVAAVRRCWDQGDAVFPVDQRWPFPTRRAMFDSIRPTHIIDPHDQLHGVENGLPAEPGDALVIATSGSSGVPKGVVHTHSSLLASATACHNRIGISNAHWLACLPPSHIGGFSVISRSILLDIPMSLARANDPLAIAEAVAGGANYISVVPAMLDRIDAIQFDVILLGGSRPPLVRPHNSIATYGSTETASGVAYDGIALNGVEITVSNDGSVLVRGNMLLRTYRNGHDPKDSQGWFNTGDIGQISDTGVLNILGRRGDMIITGGENVWPDQVEKVLITHPEVSDCAVTGVHDQRWGQRVCAWLVINNPDSAPTLEAIREYVKSVLPAYCAPHNIFIVSALPRTSTGKIDRKQLVSN